MITIEVLAEAGYEQALLGLSLSYRASLEKIPRIAVKLAHRGNGENKFLESIMVWLDIKAPRYWWQQADTYRLGTKQSESTMHTILAKELKPTDFAGPIPESYLEELNQCIRTKRLAELKNLLPEGFLQRRIWCLSYKTIQNIVYQRRGHTLKEWRDFCQVMRTKLLRPEFIFEDENRRS